jgi:hypothetical protein
MPEDIDDEYRRLVRLAYLVLPGRQKRVYRLAIARRIVAQSLPRRARYAAGKGHARARTKVLRRAILPSWRLRVMLGPWLRALPARLPDPAPTVALARLDPPARAAYVLSRIESLPRHEVRDQLVEAGVREARAALEAADEVPEIAAPAVDLMPGPLVRRRSRLPVAVATVLTVLFGCGVVMTRTNGAAAPDGHRARLVTASPDAWRHAAPGFAVWPPRGELLQDRDLTGRALVAWRQRMGERDPRLLFAGSPGRAGVVLLWEGDRIARYSDALGGLEVFPAGDASSPLPLGEGRYLLAPWVTGATEARSGDSVTVRDGVTEPVRDAGGCGRGPLLRLREPGGSRVVADLGGITPAQVAYRTPSGASGTATAGVRLWKRLACALPAPARPATSATAWEFWSGRLPGGERGRWVCARYTYGDGGVTAYGTLLAGRTDHYTTGNCGQDDSDAVSGTWWRSHRRWYYVAAAGPGLTPHIEGDVGRPRVRDRFLVAKAGRAKRPPRGPVILTARAGG